MQISQKDYNRQLQNANFECDLRVNKCFAKMYFICCYIPNVFQCKNSKPLCSSLRSRGLDSFEPLGQCTTVLLFRELEPATLQLHAKSFNHLALGCHDSLYVLIGWWFSNYSLLHCQKAASQFKTNFTCVLKKASDT